MTKFHLQFLFGLQDFTAGKFIFGQLFLTNLNVGYKKKQKLSWIKQPRPPVINQTVSSVNILSDSYGTVYR